VAKGNELKKQLAERGERLLIVDAQPVEEVIER
jgi:hypothetical protein